MRTAELVDAVLDGAGRDSIVVSSLGRVSEEAYRAWPERTLFLDAMGAVTPVGLGIALAEPSLPVIVLDTDGSFLMNLSSLLGLAGVAATLPHLTVVVVDNQLYESAGGLQSRCCPLDWQQLMAAVGLDVTVASEVVDVPRCGAAPHAQIVVGVVHDQDDPPDATKTFDGASSAGRVEHAIACSSGRPFRRPAVKP